MSTVIIVIGFCVAFMVSALISTIIVFRRLATKSQAIQMNRDYLEYVNPVGELPAYIKRGVYVTGVKTTVGFEILQRKQDNSKQVHDYILSENIDVAERPELYEMMSIPYSDIKSIRRGAYIVDVGEMVGNGESCRYIHTYEIKSVDKTVYIDVDDLCATTIINLINHCLFFNNEIEIDGAIRTIVVKRSVPYLLSDKRTATLINRDDVDFDGRNEALRSLTMRKIGQELF